MTRFFLASVLFLLVGYGIIEAWPLLAGPSLSIDSPREDGVAFPGGIVTVRGTASRIAMITLDGASVLHDEDGNFSTTITLPAGGSILTLVATDRFGRRITTSRSVFVPE